MSRSFKGSVLSFFPHSTITSLSESEGYLVSVVSDRGNLLIAEEGKSSQEAWQKAYITIHEIWRAVLSMRAIATLLINPEFGANDDAVQQRTMGS